uniref:Reverse transcriptase Ty1/copia-type domain-containing protein n=1 Tax=Lactuca sativa TaxID=4236 RepID=A0A9R1WSI3_LACSA|nr:hypothetical protein LSAT_V11C900506420 [Lactuca sativa]
MVPIIRKVHKTTSLDVSQPHQPSKDSSSTKARVEVETSSNDSILKSPLESSEPFTPTSHHQCGPVITPVTASFKEEPHLDGSIHKGTFTSDNPPRIKEQYETSSDSFNNQESMIICKLSIHDKAQRNQRDWVNAIQEELAEFECNNVWDLVPTPEGVSFVGSRWVYRNKSDEYGVIIRNKARMVVKGYSKQEGIDYDETFAPIAIIVAIRNFLAFLHTRSLRFTKWICSVHS